MNGRAKNLALASLGTALGVVLLYLGSVLPTGRLVFLCVTSLGTVFVFLNGGVRWGLGSYAATSLLSLLLLPQKGMALLFTALAGYYPMVKLWLERKPSPWLRWGGKLLLFNAVFALLFFLASGVFSLNLGGTLPVWLLFVLANAAFLLYDWALGCCILFYLRKIAGRIR